MLYACGPDDIYNQWATAANDSSWNYANMLQYIKKHQKVHDPAAATGTCASFHGTTGPLDITNPGIDADEFIPVIQNAATQASHTIKTDFDCGAPYTG
jgi:hypothetical protein